MEIKITGESHVASAASDANGSFGQPAAVMKSLLDVCWQEIKGGSVDFGV